MVASETDLAKTLTENVPIPQLVRWTVLMAKFVVHGRKATDTRPLGTLKPELEERLLPSLFASPRGYSFVTRNFNEKKHWLVQVIDHHGEPYCDVWFGGNPDTGFAFDGLIRVGGWEKPPHTWQVYQRYSDGTYRRLHSAYRNLEAVPAEQRRPTVVGVSVPE